MGFKKGMAKYELSGDRSPERSFRVTDIVAVIDSIIENHGSGGYGIRQCSVPQGKTKAPLSGHG